MPITTTFLNSRESLIPERDTIELNGAEFTTLIRQYRASVQVLYEGDSQSILNFLNGNIIMGSSWGYYSGLLADLIPVTDQTSYQIDFQLNFPTEIYEYLLYTVSEVVTNYDKTNHDIMTVVLTLDVLGPYEYGSQATLDEALEFSLLQPFRY
jgi:hypothetical protein